MNDQKIIQLLKNGERSKVFQKLYSGYGIIEKLILSKGGSKEEAQDIFQESLIIFYKKAKKEEFKLTASISTYLYSVARFLWKDELLKKQKRSNIDYEIKLSSKEEELSDVIENESRFKLIEQVLESIGEKCLKILQLFYYSGLSMKEIARKVDLRSEKVAKNQKYKCLERAKLKLRQIQENKLNQL